MSLEVLRESYELDYERIVFEGVSDYGFDEIFMECCIASGYTMDEAVDAALQKFRLYASEEAKICKKLAKETQKAIKAKRYDDALDSAKRRLAHLKNLYVRSNDIDDDEAYIIQTEAIIRTFVVAFITTAVLVKIVNGVIPGSGWLIDAVRKVVNQYKVHKFSDTLKGGLGAFIRDIIEPVLSIAGLAKMTSSAAAKHRLSKWEKNRGEDVNREVNAGRPDVTRMSVSRTEAKTRFTKLVKAQEDEIKMIESLKRAAGNKTPKNESAIDESATLAGLGFSALLLAGGIAGKRILDARNEAKRKADEDARLAANNKAKRDEAVARLKAAKLVAEGQFDVTETSIWDLKIVGCSASNAEKYVSRYLETHGNGDSDYLRDFIDECRSMAHRDPDTPSDMVELLEKYENDPVIVIDTEGTYEIIFYNGRTKLVHTVTFGKGEKTEPFTKLYDKLVVPGTMLRNAKKLMSESAAILQEAKLSSDKRNDLDSDQFGIPDHRKYPLNDKAHVKAAIKMFSHCPEKERRKLAINVLKAMEKFGMPAEIHASSPMAKYVPKKYIVR